MLSSCPKDVILAPTDFRRGIFLSVDCLKRRRYAALVGLGRPSAWDEGEDRAHTSLPVSTTRTMLSKKAARMGDKAKPSGVGAPTALLFVEAHFTKKRAAHRSGPKF